MKLLNEIIYAIEKNHDFLDGFNEEESDKMYNFIMKLPELIKELEHHKHTTVGLWATDRPELIKNYKSLLFEIK